MIPSTAALAISIVRGLIKLGGRLDVLLAEQAATTNPLTLPMPDVTAGPDVLTMIREFKQAIAPGSELLPNFTNPDVKKLKQAFLDAESPDQTVRERVSASIKNLSRKYFPEKAIAPVISPDSAYIQDLQNYFPSLDFQDQDTRLAAFYVQAGRDDREIQYAGRIALLVVDVLAEFGAENTSLFLRDPRAQTIASSILTRFSKPDLEAFDQWSPLLRHVLSATLNGLLDARKAYEGDDPWLLALLDAVQSARKDVGDDFLIGLFRGKGYRVLIGSALIEASERLGNEGAKEYQKVIVDVFKNAAGLVTVNEKEFGPFFKDHWGDLFAAGLSSLATHGPGMLQGTNPLLKETLLAIVGQLAKTDQTSLFTSGTLVQLVEAAIGAIATNPDLITGGVNEPWLKDLIESLLNVASDSGIRKTFSKEGVETVLLTATGVIAQYPGLIARDSRLLQKTVGEILTQITGIDQISARNIAAAAVGGSLRAIADNPELLNTKYPDLVSDFAGRVSGLVKNKTISGLQAGHLMSAATDSMVTYPILFDQLDTKVSGAILQAVTTATQDSGSKLIGGSMIVSLVGALIEVVARHGRNLMGSEPVAALTDKLTQVIAAAIARTEVELGRQMSLEALPIVTRKLVSALARKELGTIDPNDPNFKRLFSQFAAQAVA